MCKKCGIFQNFITPIHTYYQSIRVYDFTLHFKMRLFLTHQLWILFISDSLRYSYCYYKSLKYASGSLTNIIKYKGPKMEHWGIPEIWDIKRNLTPLTSIYWEQLLK